MILILTLVAVMLFFGNPHDRIKTNNALLAKAPLACNYEFDLFSKIAISKSSYYIIVVLGVRGRPHSV